MIVRNINLLLDLKFYQINENSGDLGCFQSIISGEFLNSAREVVIDSDEFGIPGSFLVSLVQEKSELAKDELKHCFFY